ncbi:MAG TPA: hypothetical protein VFV95_18340 [Vicinamibacterales bacterium]|nr:hypothetical protein [Vicinamibacterales bacterium]
MDEVRVVRRRTLAWPLLIAILIVVIIVGWLLFSMRGTPRSGLRSVPSADRPVAMVVAGAPR